MKLRTTDSVAVFVLKFLFLFHLYMQYTVVVASPTLNLIEQLLICTSYN